MPSGKQKDVPFTFQERLLIVCLFIALFYIVYFVIGHAPIKKGIFYSVQLDGEEEIPFIPLSVFIYAAIYVIPIAVFFVLETREAVFSCIKAFAATLLFHGLIWFYFPVQMELRPHHLPLMSDWLKAFILFLFRMDFPPVNCFPSLHVTYAFLTYFAVKRYRPHLRFFFLVLAILVAISTLTFKQHYLADVASGFVVSLIGNAIFLQKKKVLA